MTAPAVLLADGLPLPRRWLAATAIWLAMAVTVLDSAIANIALPVIARAFGTSPITSLWVIHIYQLAIVCSILTLAAIGERTGYRRVYLAGLVVFIAASCGCAGSGSIQGLIGWRLAQGLGAAAIMSVNGALVRFTFPGRQLGQAFGINALVIAISATAAPAIAGVVLALVSWRWLFGLNLAVGLPALAIGWRALPDARGRQSRLDTASALLTAGALASLFAGCAIGLERGDLWLAGLGLAAFAVLAVPLYRRACTQPQPLLPVDLMGQPLLRRAYFASICSFAAQTLLLVAMPFYLHNGFHYGLLATGLTVAAIPLGLCLAAPLAGRRADRASVPALAAVTNPGAMGLPLAVCGMVALALVPGARPLAVALGGLVCGLGFGLFQAPNSRTMISGAPAPRSGAAAGMLALSRLCGQITGVLAAGLMLRHLPVTSSRFGLVAAAIASIGAVIARRRQSGSRSW